MNVKEAGRATDRAGADPRLPRCAVAPAPPRCGEYAWTPRCVASWSEEDAARARAFGPPAERFRARGSGRLARARAAVDPPPARPRPSQSRRIETIEYRAAVGVAPRAAARGSGRIYKKAMFCVSNFEMTSRFP